MLTDAGKLDAFERFVKFGRRRPKDGVYSDVELGRLATIFRKETIWGAEIDAEWLVKGLRARFNAASAKSARERSAARKRAATKKANELHAQLRAEIERPQFKF